MLKRGDAAFCEACFKLTGTGTGTLPMPDCGDDKYSNTAVDMLRRVLGTADATGLLNTEDDDAVATVRGGDTVGKHNVR